MTAAILESQQSADPSVPQPELKDLLDRDQNLDDDCEFGEEFIAQTLRENAVKCFKCGSDILTTDGVTVNSHYFHRSCLTCSVCDEIFQPNEELFTGKDNTILCCDCAASNQDKLKTQETCYFCKKAITGSPMMALEQLWHVECFTCAGCDIILTALFRDHDGIPYCEDCWLVNYGKKCSICKEFIIDSVMTIEANDYHIQCVRCCVCKNVFDNVIDILNIDTDFWHIECFKEGDESETSSTSSALLGVYNMNTAVLGSSTGTVKSRRRSAVSYTTPSPVQKPVVVEASPSMSRVNSMKSVEGPGESGRSTALSGRDKLNQSQGNRSTCCVLC